MTHRPIVAVADDDAITRAALEEVLSDRFDVRTFESGQAVLDHLESCPGMRIVTTGPNLGFAYGDVTLLVRSVAWALDATAPQTVDAMGRARDNLALVVEGALSRLKALEAEADARHLAVASRLIDATREALRDQEVTAQEIYRDLDAIFESVREDFEFLFPQLGLTPDQEQRLADIVAQQRIRGLGIVTRGRSAGQRLRRLLDHLERSAPSAAAP